MTKELKLETIDDIVRLGVNEHLKERNINKRIWQIDKEINTLMNERHTLLHELHFFEKEKPVPKWIPYVEAKIKDAIAKLEELEERRKDKYANIKE